MEEQDEVFTVVPFCSGTEGKTGLPSTASPHPAPQPRLSLPLAARHASDAGPTGTHQSLWLGQQSTGAGCDWQLRTPQ